MFTKFRTSDIFNSSNIKSSQHQKNSTFSSPYQSKYVQQPNQNENYRIFTIQNENPALKKKVYFRSNLIIQYIPQFIVVSQNSQNITIKIKEYKLQLLPWLIKKDSLFKANLILGIYIAFLQLIDIYGLFPLHPNMMRVNQKQQVAVWINKNFQSFQSDQTLKRNQFSLKQYMKSFLRIFRCCLPNKKIPQMYNDTKELLNQLAKLKRKEQIHKNCHQFIIHDTKTLSSRKSNKLYSHNMAQSSKRIEQTFKQTPSQMKINSVTILSNKNKSFKSKEKRLSSFSPLRRQQKSVSLKKRFSQTNGFVSQKNLSFLNRKKAHENNKINQQQSEKVSKKVLSLSSTGQLFKRYLMYNSSKFQKMSKTFQSTYFSHKNKINGSNTFIFQSDVHQLPQNFVFSQTIIQQPFFDSQREERSQNTIHQNIFSPIKFRKFSTNTNQKKNQVLDQKRFMNSSNFRHQFKENDNDIFGNDGEQSPKNDTKQKLKTSFPYKTASTLTTFRLSNQNQMGIIPCKSQQNLNNNISTSSIPLCLKEKDKKISEMKIVQENQLENDFNNIFSMENSGYLNDEQQKKLQKMLSQFEDIVF